MIASPVWSQAGGKLRDSEPYRRLLAGGGSVAGLPLAAAAWVLSTAAEELSAPLLIVVPHEPAAQGWIEASRLFGATVEFFPVGGLSPYQAADVSLPVRAQQVVALEAWLRGEARSLVCTAPGLFQRLPVGESPVAAVVEMRAGDEVSVEDLAERLTSAGYQRSDLVGDVGEFAVRGGVFDVFSPGARRPVRLDLFGEQVESVRDFEVENQRSTGDREVARVLPLNLFSVSADAARSLASRLESGLGKLSSEARADLEALRSRGGFPGWTALLPALAPETSSLARLSQSARLVVVHPEAVNEAVDAYWALHQRDYEASRDERHLTIPPEELEWPVEAVSRTLESAWVRLEDLTETSSAVDFRASETDDFVRQLPRFPRELESAAERGERVVLVAPEEHRPRLESYLADQPHGATVLIEAGDLQRGFRLPAAGMAIYSERQLFRDLGPPARRRRSRLGPFVSGLRDLRIGDFVVHEEHGIGRFVSLQHVGTGAADAPPLPAALESMREDAVNAEVMELEYANRRRLLLPLTRLDLIEKYSGVEGIAPRLDRLGGSSWSRTKSRVRAGMRKLAVDLLRLYAERQVQKAPAMPPDDDLQSQFEAAFEYEETRDQLEATAAIKADLETARPMDRLLCGDVGFGKTEVAMRAAFKVVAGGHQVAVLAPTTILADQHLETFRQRFESFPVTVEMISRFRSAAEIREVAAAAAQGRVDILVGTHRILSQDIEMPRLGLLVVDEEQRFGVAQKERFKELRRDVHVLAMSATPVPRTLQLSLAGVRDLSVIETPPRDRMAVETAIVAFGKQLVAEAIEFELARGGQVYYVYNHVEGIETIQETLKEIVPEARITVGHGQMDERELARRMHAFKRGEHDVLLATTIIENGIDIPNVNTMLVHRADRFGLAQLYQLRGRVGRSDQLAYCYLLVPSDRSLSEVARRRLSAIREFTELGAGFRIAARDLEIRGAGNLLGAEQSGHMAAVGIETYLTMLEDTVRELRGEEVVAKSLDGDRSAGTDGDPGGLRQRRQSAYGALSSDRPQRCRQRRDSRRTGGSIRQATVRGARTARCGVAQAPGRGAASAVDLGTTWGLAHPTAAGHDDRRRPAGPTGLRAPGSRLQSFGRAHCQRSRCPGDGRRLPRTVRRPHLSRSVPKGLVEVVAETLPG